MQNPDTAVPFLRWRIAFESVIAAAKRPGLADVPAFRTWTVILLIAGSYYVGSKIGFFLTPSDNPISMFWPANAILLAGFLLTPARIWWVLLVALLPIHLAVQLQTGVPIFSALGWFVGNTGEALLGAICIRLFKKESPLFESVRGMVIFLTFGVLLAPLASSFVDVVSALRIGEVKSYWLLWDIRLSTNMIAVLAVVPILVTFAVKRTSWFHRPTFAWCVEAGTLASCVLIVSVAIFGANPSSMKLPMAFVYVPLLLLLWAAVRFGPVGLSTSLLGVVLISACEAVRNHGTFGTPFSPQDIVSLHILLTVFAFPLMLLAALLTEKHTNDAMLELTRNALIHAHEQERERIARELHTYVAGQLTMVGLGVEELRGVSSTYARPVLERLYDQISNIGSTMLRLTHKIHPFNVEYLGLARALTKLCRDTGAESGLIIRSLVEDVPPELPVDASIRLFRIVQLALENAIESAAKRADIQLLVDPRRVLLRIADVCASGSTQPRPEIEGLAYMREQVLSLGGTFEAIMSSPNGMFIEASIPINHGSAPSEFAI